MKHFLWLPLVVLLMPTLSQAQTVQETEKRMEALIQEGNHREAADLGKKTLLSPAGTPRLLELTTQALRDLQAFPEQEEVIEGAVKTHSQSWQMLLAAGQSYRGLPHGGMLVDGKFERGHHRWVRGGGSFVQTQLRDRVRTLQLFEAAWKALPADADSSAKTTVLMDLSSALSQNQYGTPQAWTLQHLTDLTTLPDYDDQSGLDSPASGYPVDAEGNPVYFKAAESWATAQSDGERLFWVMEEQARISGDPHAGIAERAALAKSWFSVRSIAEMGFRFSNDEEEPSRRDGIAALQTLNDDETVVKLATGPKRLTLPPEWNFMKLFKGLASDPNEKQIKRAEAWQTLADEWTDRRQYPKAVEALKNGISVLPRLNEKDQKLLDARLKGAQPSLLPPLVDPDSFNSLESSLVATLSEAIHQITAPQGDFDPLPPQAAGSEAKLTLTFRNATQIQMIARRVDVVKLLADTEAYLRSSPQQQDWQKANVANIGQRLLQEGGDKYLIGEAVTWKHKLEPRENHWDRRVSVPTPLKETGAWLVEGSFEGGHKTRALLWLESLVIAHTKQEGAGHYYIADAVTGAPVAGATVRFFGYKREWTDRRRDNRPILKYSFKDFQVTSDDNGQVKAKDSQVNEYQWLIQAKSAEGRLAYLGFEHLYFGGGRDRFDEQTRLYTITDRPVYRPGQEVKWKAWARRVGYDPKVDTNKYAGASIEVVITDPRGEELLKKIYRSDDSGAIDDVLTLGDEATLGQYQVRMEAKRMLRGSEYLGSHSFRVEEYKKPEFEVKVDAPTTPVALGDSFEMKIKADYYFGGPVKQGKVKYKVQRSPHTDRWFPMGRWDWLFGAGYGWRANYYSWYPGSEKWCFCIPRYPWVQWQSEPPELVAEGESPLNADGIFTVKVDTALAKELHGNEDHRYAIEAEVTDESRRTIFGSGSVLAARRPFEVYVSLDRGYYQAGEEGKVTVHARTLDGREVKASGELTLFRITYDKDGKPSEEAVHTAELKLGGEEAKPQLGPNWTTITFARSGQYRVSAKLKDEAGHEIEGISFITVRGEGFDEGKDFRFDDLELITQKDEYEPGEEVEITLNTDQPGSTVALFLRTQNGVYPDPVWIKLEGKSTTHRFKLSEADQPNIFLDAYTVSQARVHQVTRQIIIPPKKRIATVELTPDSETYLPGQGSKVKVLVKDQDGKPFVGKVVLTAYDKALEYISGGSNQEDIRPFFWGWKRSHYPQVSDSLHALQNGLRKGDEPWMAPLGVFGGSVADDGILLGGVGNVYNGRSQSSMRRGGMKLLEGGLHEELSAPMASAAPAPDSAMPPADMFSKDNAAGGETDGPQPMIRSNLADSAVWIADFTTDEKGEGEFSFNLPDNLTTWKLRAWVMGPSTQVGEAGVEVITRKNLMVRLQAPRFFVEKDEVVISANVHNEMDVKQSVKAVLEFEGGVLEFVNADEGVRTSVTIAAHGEKSFDWRVKVTGEGEAKIRVKALAQKDSDAMEMTFPAYIHGMLKTDAWSLALRPDQASGKITFKVPAERKPEQSRLEVRYSPTLAMALVDALPYLVDYPYGCTEQTLNRFVPTIITLGVIKDLGVDLKDVRDKLTNLNAQEIGKPEDRAKRWQNRNQKKVPVFDEDEVKKMAKTGMARLEAMRGSDDGWGWFPGGRQSSPHITAIVMHGLKAAERTGFDINDGLLRNGANWLAQHETEQLRRLALPEKDKQHKSAPDNLDALIHSVLVEYQAGNKSMRDQLYEKRDRLSRYNLALLGLTCHAVEEKDRRDMCLRNLKQFLKQDDENQTAYLELPQGGWWWYWYEDQIETQAAFLRLLVAAEPKGETAARIAKYLLNNRRNGTYWNSTKDTAAVIEALAVFAKASGESNPNQTVEVLVDGKSVKKVEITKENLFTFDGSLVIEGANLTTGEHTVELRKLGASPLYANAYLTVFSQEDMIPAAGLEVKARRKFYKLIEEKPEQQVAGSRGQVVTQRGLKYRREEIASDAPIKSGDLIEIELSIDSKNDYEYVLIEDMKPAGFEPVKVQSGWVYEGLPAYQEFRDEKVAFFAERLPRGTHNLSYRVKAEIPGRFSALPTKVEAMYAPELKGNSAEWKARIGE
ncbi:MG2 domain-containing protein [Prosthecobacter sp. SYSU 5D2]|uniref:alpha-2-macroglobulin family protein n=1 Tax=Prosthecobacter sp. SYSU 5D2 TaxID=3134134 RepID=UPI0031FE6817